MKLGDLIDLYLIYKQWTIYKILIIYIMNELFVIKTFFLNQRKCSDIGQQSKIKPNIDKLILHGLILALQLKVSYIWGKKYYLQTKHASKIDNKVIKTQYSSRNTKNSCMA